MNMYVKLTGSWLLLFFVTLFLSACSPEPDDTPTPVQINLDQKESYVIQCNGSCDTISKTVTANGGEITTEYSSINALAVSMPVVNLDKLGKSTGLQTLSKDNAIGSPPPLNEVKVSDAAITRHLDIDSLRTVTLANAQPNNYLFNAALTGTSSVHAQDITGAGVIVAIIDSGTANNAEVVPALAGSVIGGENFVDLPDEPSATSTLNESHGTWVGSMIAAHMALVVPNDAEIAKSWMANVPDSVIPESETESLIPMLGTAPDASLYALKVFDAAGGAASSSVVLQAMDRALTLKRNYNDGVPSEPVSGDGSEDNPFVYDSLNIQVVNMSLGGETMFPGREVEDRMVREMLKEGITVVVAIGNDGFTAITGGSPGTSVASVTVGAVSTPQHERVLRDLQFGEGIGKLFRPNMTTQTAYFSSRGPTADGRTGLQLVANGFASFVQGADGDISFVSGTSFSAPTVAGAAALLWQAFPDAEANSIRSALMNSADTSIIVDNNMAIDRGKGMLQVNSALAMLAGSDRESDIPDLPELDNRPTTVAKNIDNLNLRAVGQSDDYSNKNISLDIALIPGEVKHVFVPIRLNTQKLMIDLTNFTAALPVEAQNPLFDDAILLTVSDSPTSWSDVLVDERILADSAFTLDMPQTGLVRVGIMGDWTNVGSVSTTLNIRAIQRRLPRPFKTGSLRDEEVDAFRLKVPRETTQLNFELSWNGDWGSYPPHDIDLIVLDPDDMPYFDAATLDSPERLTIDNPVRGKWKMLVTGFMLHGYRDRYALRITDQDGRALEDDDD